MRSLRRAPTGPPSMAERITDLERRIRKLGMLIALLMLIITLLTIGLVNLIEENSTRQREGLESRVHTVQQRCDLTNKITDVLRLDDPPRVPSFERSLQHCIAQEDEVQNLLEHAK